jgi:hypothetical protein
MNKVCYPNSTEIHYLSVCQRGVDNFHVYKIIHLHR